MKNKINSEVKEIWNTNAAFWDERIGEANDFHKILLDPNTLLMLDINKGDRILEIACGNGQFSRIMTREGAKVTAIDLSDEFIKIAKTKPLANKIDYQVIDVCNPDDLNKLKGNSFDAAVCAMGLMDMENIEPLIRFLPEIIKNNGKFVFSIMHPCFNSGDSTLVYERNDIGGKVNDSFYVKTGKHLKSHAYKGIGIVGQPKAQWYFHRPISEYMRICFKSGFCLIDLREPSFKETETKSIYNNVFINNPPALICSFKLMK